MFKMSNTTKSSKVKVRNTFSQSLLFGSRRGIIIVPKNARNSCRVLALAMDVRLLRAAEASGTNVSPFIEWEVHVFADYAQVWQYDTREVVNGIWHSAGVAAACAPVRRSSSEIFCADCALVGGV
jgi:hypothetical protein